MAENSEMVSSKEKNLSLQLTALFIAVILLLTLYLGWSNYSNSKSAYIEAEANRLAEIGSMNKNQIMKWLEDRQDEIRYLASLEEAKTLDRERLQALLLRVADIQGFYDSVFLVDPDGIGYVGIRYERRAEILSDQDTANFRVADRQWFQQVISGEETFSDPLISRATANYVITVAAPITNSNEEIIGVMRGALRLNTILEGVHGLELSYNTDVYFVDSEGYVIAPVVMPLTAETALDTEATLAISEGHSDAGLYDRGRGKEVIGSYTYLPILDWGLILEADYKETMAPFYSSWRINVLTLAIVAIVMSLLGAILINRLVAQPLKKVNSELERRVMERTAQLESTNQELQAFAYSISHDLRAPLRALDNFSDILLSDYSGQIDEEGQHYLQRIKHAALRMNEFIEALLVLSRVTQADLKPGPVDLSTIAAEVAAEMQMGDMEREVKVEVARGMNTWGDYKLIRIMLENLIDNAWKYSAKNQEALVQVGAIEKENKKIFFVRDNGAGFNMRYADKLFVPFQRLHHEDEFKGMGIGLATVQRIITMHGGSIWAESVEGAGTTFYFTL